MQAIPRIRSSQLLLVALMSLTLVALGQTDAHAATRSDCNGSVCEEVTSSGSTVTDWFATVYPGSGYHCRTARFYVNGGLIDTDHACGTGLLVADADTPYSLWSGARLCASFVDEPGYACITI